MSVNRVKWEYETKSFRRDEAYTYEEIDKSLNVYGEDGWECYHIERGKAFKNPYWKEQNDLSEHYYVDLYLKRPIVEDSE